VTRETVRVLAKTHYAHIVGRRPRGAEYDIIIPRPKFEEPPASPRLPQRLTFEASWIYDLTEGKILKNKTGKSVVSCIDAEEVDADWLIQNRYVIPSAQPGHDVR
jgi:hypothetical protein